VRAVVDQAVIRAAGDVTLNASELATIKSKSTVASVTVSISIGAAVSGGGAKSVNTIDTRTEAWVDASGAGRSSVSTPGALSVTAQSAVGTDSRVVAAAAAFGAVGAAAAGTVADNVLRPVTKAVINRSDIDAGVVSIIALGQQTGMSMTAALAVSTGTSVGMAKSSILSSATVQALIGDGVDLLANSLRVDARSADTLDMKAVAASGGLSDAVAGAYTDLTISGKTLAGMGEGSTLRAQTVDIRSARTQNFDAASFNLAIGQFAGSGALIKSTVDSSAEVFIGEDNEVQAVTLLISAQNTADKRRYSDKDNLRSGSAGAINIAALAAVTDIGTESNPFASTVFIGKGSLLNVSAPSGSQGILRIETLVDVTAIDKVRVEGIAGLGISVANVKLESNTLSSTQVAGAQLRNQSGDVTISARSDADLTPAANTFSAGLINGAGAIANGSIFAVNAINVHASGQTPAGITGDNVNLYAGRDAFGVSNQLIGSAHADMALASLFGIGIPVAIMAIDEVNRIDIGQQTSLGAVQDVNLVAEPGLGGKDRAKTDGMVVKIGGTPYIAFALPGRNVSMTLRHE